MSSPASLLRTGTPTYEGPGQPKAACSTGVVGWFNELLGFPCTPEYETGSGYREDPSPCGSPHAEGYAPESVYVVSPQ
jgi:hypothetical protein